MLRNVDICMVLVLHAQTCTRVARPVVIIIDLITVRVALRPSRFLRLSHDCCASSSRSFDDNRDDRDDEIARSPMGAHTYTSAAPVH